ncbi:tetrahydromethanopterin S-methyltransferase subunit H [Candidatus Bathyarchaeota archaeon ex4484_135]|nr:MAG: tetrahydromethanopterin S-methyltransferase subunit H [Candidatus Bathyarchaeota archaeon ex4484_135]
MFEFKCEPEEIEIAGVKIGGPPGKNPTVLAGTIFYHGHKIVKDPEKGEFDKERAEELIKLQEEFSDKTGNPCMVDVMASSPTAMVKYLDFVADITDRPILIDGTTAKVKIAGIEHAAEVGLLDRLIYNSLSPGFAKEELDKIREVGLKSVILLALNMREFTTAGRIKAVKELLDVALANGIDKPLIDTCVMDIPSLGMACKALFKLKSELGWPVGCSPHNAIDTWRGLRTKMGKEAVKPCMASASVMAVAVGADFILYGPISAAKYVFPAIAMVDAAYAFLLREEGMAVGKEHPLYKIA